MGRLCRRTRHTPGALAVQSFLSRRQDSALRPEEAGGGSREEWNAKGENSNIGKGGKDEDGPVDCERAGRHWGHQSPSEGREDKEAKLQDPGHALRRCVGRDKQDQRVGGKQGGKVKCGEGQLDFGWFVIPLFFLVARSFWLRF
ncbi:hypothetical protein NDU88_005128 [Pleurodeles waltl]|uniref:Uncharacterized protein n=1 Tax=Pleurodeles waltl TaxID=8319 RepID=A0AAV7MXE5_PLEWA|nr:hypothetical protein NDU88_005128 [Pleurodeles waltl]